MTDEAQDLPSGARLLDRYRIVDRVAGGGMATIHRAVDERFDRIVCVKLLRLELDLGGSTGSKGPSNPVYHHFLREALALSKLQHPNTLRIYDFGYTDDGHRPFQVSEFLDGGNLRQHVRARGALSPEETLAILERITGAIAEAHEHKILHRDIKPSNILFARVGEVLMPKLADFGIARTLAGKRSHHDDAPAGDDDANLGVGMFSPRWAAPEQLAGQTEGPATDVYALGLVTAFMLSGVAPFDAARPADARDETDEVLRRRFVAMGTEPAALDTLLRAVAFDPVSRTKTPVLFFEELRTALGGVRMSLPARDGEATRPLTAGARSAPVLPTLPPAEAGARRVRIVDVFEKLELDLPGGGATPSRFRLSIVPEKDRAFRIQVKGLNCFVAKVIAGGTSRPTPALSATDDTVVEFVSTRRQVLGRATLSFGRESPGGGGHVFATAAGALVVPSLPASFSVAVDLGPEQELIVMCKRT